MVLRSSLALVALLGAGSSTAIAGQQAAPPAQPTSQAQQAAQTLPGGASQMQETHGDWRVTCAQPNGQKVCTLSQQLADSNSRQLVLGIELRSTSADKAEGTLVLPFGLAVDKPVTLQVDEGAPTTLNFRTCVPVGCLVLLNFDAATISALRKGTVLHVKSTAADSSKDAEFKVSLTGFGSAIDRTAALSK